VALRQAFSPSTSVLPYQYHISVFIHRRRDLFYLLFTAGVEVFVFHFITLRHTSQSVGLLWTRDRTVAETST
jgi:hypothetical protein